MSDGKYFFKSTSDELLQDILQDNSIAGIKLAKTPKHKLACMKRIVANITMGNNEMINLMPQVLTIYSDADLECQRLCCYFFDSYSAFHPQGYFDNREAFVKKLNDSSPEVRSLTVKTVSKFTSETFQEEVVIPHVQRNISDHAPMVRKSACYAIGKIYQLFPDLASKNELPSLLVDALEDNNPEVISAALSVLDYISESHLNESRWDWVLSNRRTKILLSNLSSLKASNFSHVYILNALMKFVPQTGSDAEDIISRILPFLQNRYFSVVINTIKVIIYMANYIKDPQDVMPGLPRRLGHAVVSCFSSCVEMEFLALRNVILLLLAKPELVQLDVTDFFCNYSDPIYIKDTKLEIIYLLASNANLPVVLRELEQYSTEPDVSMSRKSIRAIGNLAVKLEDDPKLCVEVLERLASNESPYVIKEIVIVMKNIYRKYPDMVSVRVLEFLVEHANFIDEPEPKASLLWVVGNFSQHIPNALNLLKDFAFTFKEEDIEVQLTLLTSVVKYYLNNKKQSEELLLRVLKMGTEELRDPDLRERSYFYWRLLSTQNTFPGSAEDVILAALPTINSKQDKLDPDVLEDLELNIGTLASIYLKPVRSVFRLNRNKALQSSPALQREYNKSISSPASEVSTKFEKIDIHSHFTKIKYNNNTNKENFVNDKQRYSLLKKKSKDLLSFSEPIPEGKTANLKSPQPEGSKNQRIDNLKKKITLSRKRSILKSR